MTVNDARVRHAGRGEYEEALVMYDKDPSVRRGESKLFRVGRPEQPASGVVVTSMP